MYVLLNSYLTRYTYRSGHLKAVWRKRAHFPLLIAVSRNVTCKKRAIVGHLVSEAIYMYM